MLLCCRKPRVYLLAPSHIHHGMWRTKTEHYQINQNFHSLFPTNKIRPTINSRQRSNFHSRAKHYATEALYDSAGLSSSPGRPNIRRFRSIDPTAMYFESAPNFTHVAFPAKRKSSSRVLVTVQTWKTVKRNENIS